MIQRFNFSNKKEVPWLLDFCSENFSYDFYYSSNNIKNYINDIHNLNVLIKNSREVFVSIEKGDYTGIITIIKVLNKDKGLRNYVKINAINSKVAKDLLTVLVWNFKEDLFIKIRNDNKFLSVFKEKSFKFIETKGVQILLKRKYKEGIIKCLI